IGRRRLGLLAAELLCTTESQQELFVEEVLRAEPLEGGLERIDGLRIVPLGFPRVRDAAAAERLERPGRAPGERELVRGARLGVLLRLEPEVTQEVRDLCGLATGGILRERGLQ